jgi:membrane protein implicated in regulation of membrane protease activity
MSDFMEWYNLIFYIPLAIGILSVLGIGFSGVGHDVGIHGDIHGDLHVDSDHDADGDHDGEGQSTWGWVLGFLGFGRVPIAISFMSLFLIFGGTGICINTLISALINIWSGFALVSVSVALVVMFFGTAFVSRTVGRFMPTTETDSVRKSDLIGCTGTVTLNCDKSGGLAQIRNKRGDLYQVQCRSDKPIAKGTPILTYEYSESSDVYTVITDPTFSG